jgi:glutaredoxin
MLTIYSKLQCTHCDQAIALLTKKNIAFNVIKIDQDPRAMEFVISQGHKTVPQIYQGTELYVAGGLQGLIKKLSTTQEA